MKRSHNLKALLAIASILILSVTVLSAQKTGSQTVGQKYDLTTETKLKGTVDEVKVVPGPSEGVHLVLKSGTETTLVHVAPEAFLKEMDVTFDKGDQIELLGSKIKVDGQDEVLAREITKNGNQLTLRDKKGMPIWSVWDPGKK
jgi:DNA/RNA endonuclease YhcR with UshA esterase domain